MNPDGNQGGFGPGGNQGGFGPGGNNGRPMRNLRKRKLQSNQMNSQCFIFHIYIYGGDIYVNTESDGLDANGNIIKSFKQDIDEIEIYPKTSYGFVYLKLNE